MSLKNLIRYGATAMAIFVMSSLALGISRQAAYVKTVQSARSAEHLRFIAESLYAEGLQMGQATRNILLNPKTQASYQLHQEAVEKFTSLSAEAKELLTRMKNTESLGAILQKSQGAFTRGLALQHELHSLAKNGEVELALKRLNDEEISLWREHKVFLLDLEGSAEQLSKVLTDRAATAASNLNILWMSVAIGIFLGCVGFIYSSIVLIRKLHLQITTLSSSVAETLGASAQLSGTSKDLSSGATNQAAALQETAASVDQISAMVDKNAESSKKSLEGTASSQESASRGKSAVEEVVQAIEVINSSGTEMIHKIETSNQEISEIAKLIAEIAERTKVINDIVFQTKLLSFNASVEAARAGEHGKGFAVVAEEVGNLAQMSGNAAKEIFELLDRSTNRVDEIIRKTRSELDMVMASNKERNHRGAVAAKRCSDALDRIVEDVSAVSIMVQEIALASTEQSKGVHEITRAIGQMDQVTQQNAAAAHQAASAAEMLKHQAESVRAVVENINKIVDGARAHATQANGTSGPSVSSSDFSSSETESNAHAA